MGSIQAPERIIDIRSDQAGTELKQDIIAGLNGKEKTLPTLLLYDERGLKLFEEITYLPEYYLTNTEIEVLEAYAKDIATNIPNDSIVLELGSGNLRKIKILLEAIDQSKKKVDYYALDLDRKELQRTLEAVPAGTYESVQCFGLNGTFDDGLAWLKERQDRATTILFLGSSIGNFPRQDDAAFLKTFASNMKPIDRFIIGLDACQDATKVHSAYNDAAGVTAEFTLNGLRHANALLGKKVFDLSQWDTYGRFDSIDGKHQAFVSPKTDVEVLGVPIRCGEAVRIEESHKYSPTQKQELWRRSGLVEIASWLNKTSDYGLHLLTTSAMFASKPEQYAAHPVPSIEEWRSLWEVWDTVTRQMIPDAELQSKPIKLRNACIFYLGHIPTFLDMKISQALNAPPTQPSYFHSIFERGVDPDVDDPSQCHAHSEIPDEYPKLEEILKYQESVRERVTKMYDSGLPYENFWAGRVMWLGLEHEAMHLETLLYMLLQSEKMLPPANTPRPRNDKTKTGELVWHDIPEQTITLGIHDPDTRNGPLRHFGWDVEKPERQVVVKAFKASNRPITNGEYAKFMIENNVDIPVSWSGSKHETLDALIQDASVKTVFGAVPLADALNWPVSASYDELARCANYMGGRIPTFEEARSIYNYVEMKKPLQSLQKRIPAVNGHLVNEGVQESPPSQPELPTSDAVSPANHFVDLDRANVGFKHWHPVAVSEQLAGQAEMGGVWEWTSSALEKQEGFEPMELYPAYSADFYDGKHNIVLGGSWATLPRLAGRKSFVNWYQRNYPYVWAGARIVKD